VEIAFAGPERVDHRRVELALAKLKLWDYLEQTTSYLSVVELGLYDSSEKLYTTLAERGIAPHTPEWNAEVEGSLKRGAEAMKPRLFPSFPDAKYLCFYPMDRKRGEQVNWYTVPFAERQRMMHEHGMIGRRYGDVVKQIISGSIGFESRPSETKNEIPGAVKEPCITLFLASAGMSAPMAESPMR